MSRSGIRENLDRIINLAKGTGGYDPYCNGALDINIIYPGNCGINLVDGDKAISVGEIQHLAND
jgi:hypothetical protein